MIVTTGASAKYQIGIIDYTHLDGRVWLPPLQPPLELYTNE